MQAEPACNYQIYLKQEDEVKTKSFIPLIYPNNVQMNAIDPKSATTEDQINR